MASSEVDAVDRIKKALTNNELQTALIAAHTLKGVCATIGATFVVLPAEKLERLISEKIEKGKPLDSDELETLFVECAAKLTQMVGAIDNDQQSIQPTDNKPLFAVEVVTKLVIDLKEQIDNFDSAANETLQDIFTYIEADDLSNEVTELALSLIHI